jgi:hypothetical protein
VQGLVVNGQAAPATFGSSGFAFCALRADFAEALPAFGFCSTLPGMTLSASSLIRVRTSHRWYRSLRLEILMPSFPLPSIFEILPKICWQLFNLNRAGPQDRSLTGSGHTLCPSFRWDGILDHLTARLALLCFHSFPPNKSLSSIAAPNRTRQPRGSANRTALGTRRAGVAATKSSFRNFRCRASRPFRMSIITI